MNCFSQIPFLSTVCKGLASSHLAQLHSFFVACTALPSNHFLWKLIKLKITEFCSILLEKFQDECFSHFHFQLLCLISPEPSRSRHRHSFQQCFGDILLNLNNSFVDGMSMTMVKDDDQLCAKANKQIIECCIKPVATLANGPSLTSDLPSSRWLFSKRLVWSQLD